MPSVHRSAFVRHTPEQMFELVNNFERYPEFLPGCRRARVVERGEDYLIGSMTLAKGGVEQTVTTRNDLKRPGRIDLSLVDGPFKRLDGCWLFRDLGENACKVELEMEFEFSNRLLGMAFGRLFQQVAGQLIDAFTRRADQVYGR
ncbi:type II toxin-antitoxin system RatA family toxin [Salinicola sp. DM10]|uniref:type II toxin-antitoxin system RatA family toxin n=1 Tax=Salinicola sp. DM10 TaxID=2815721 RepID=UPI001A8CAAF1|nr:type II toxin-antitoxin system RatA family toxin [Salinicola sp. DM10]MCE3027704.1 type II toxin-antitoxin system RatA family toxin [Salinicola sp. DM10]